MRYSVTGVDGRGTVATIELDARTQAEANEQAAARGWSVVSVSGAPPWRSWWSRSPGFSLLLFSQELLSLLQAGITLVEALETLAAKEARAESRRMLEQVLRSLREGRSLSVALEQFPGRFPPLYVAALRAAERTGDVPEALGRFAAYQSQVEALRKKLITATIYPALLIAVGMLVTLFLLGYVVPRFSQVYEEMGDNLPWLSQVLLSWGKLLQQHALGVGTALAGAAIVAFRLACRHSTLEWLARQVWRIPGLGDRLRIYQLARFYRTTGMLLRGGMAAVPALHMVGGLLGPALRARLDGAIREVTEGRSLSLAMETHGLTTPVALRMLLVGERTGRMGEMMERIAVFYDEDMARWVEWFTRLFEPLLMAFIGLVIGGIVLLMYLPIFELAGSIR